MLSGPSNAKKSAVCRYFANTGSCFYGAECQFSHDAPDGLPENVGTGAPTTKFASGTAPDHPQGIVVGREANNGDQYFTATFNGFNEFSPYSQRTNSGGRGVGMQDPSPSGPPGVDHLSSGFSALNIEHSKTELKPGASEFIPKSSGTLTHSASVPSFPDYGVGPFKPGMPPASMAAQVMQQQGHSLSAGPSPAHTPTHSPLLSRRSKSPLVQLNTSVATSNAEGSGTPLQLQENVGGTTYFYTHDEAVANQQRLAFPSYSEYASVPPHIAHMKLKSNMPSFFMPDEIKMELLNKQAVTLCQVEGALDLPAEVDKYHNLVPLEPPAISPMQKSSTFGYPTSCYKAVNTEDGLTYCLRRIHGFRHIHPRCLELIDKWKKIQHSNMVCLREVFTTKSFGDHSMVFVYDYYPRSETLMSRHFSAPPMLNGYANPYNLDGAARPFSAGKGLNGPRQHAGLLPESLIWSYVVQLSSALRTIHTQGLACRVMDPTKILIVDKTRLRLNCVGIFDVLSFDPNQANPMAMMPHYQQEDLVSLGKVVLALACNSVIGIQREHIQTSMELVARNYSADLKNLILYLLTNQNRMRSVNDIMPMIGARFYTQLDAAQLRNDVLENELSKEVENGRLFRLLCKLGLINERPEFHLDPAWSETGDRYMLKLFRDFLFHQVDENSQPWIDLAHVVQCLNKLDAGVPEKICLMSRDEQSVIVVTYAELKRCVESAFNELLAPSATQVEGGAQHASMVPPQGAAQPGMASIAGMHPGMPVSHGGMPGAAGMPGPMMPGMS
ncbi:PAN2-PAN3 deadenylation complex subunit pan3 isoform X1 [Lingula anatina]|uniref:PAN2-PAN3 deadenylation complex subunit PAN3 n=1 Tax=Lingula anatina TaxID=7574 RepID=A0A1S3JQM3_LINAN|nr:PAN2-PAN3 deadenylation complex subunit pan3 isoform X1 [Lingula anatina]|eukprot:XP_013412688.1 PAN2-PAN3 deadenylation complex subunit pan3 isoform X1 [Lingula anatina]